MSTDSGPDTNTSKDPAAGEASSDTPPETAPETGKRDSGNRDSRATLKPLQVIGSVLAAGLGVQSSRNRERDFNQGRAGTFIVAGLLFTAVFIGGVYTVVTLVLASR